MIKRLFYVNIWKSNNYLRRLTGDIQSPEWTQLVTLGTHKDLAADIGITDFFANKREIKQLRNLSKGLSFSSHIIKAKPIHYKPKN